MLRMYTRSLWCCVFVQELCVTCTVFVPAEPAARVGASYHLNAVVAATEVGIDRRYLSSFTAAPRAAPRPETHGRVRIALGTIPDGYTREPLVSLEEKLDAVVYGITLKTREYHSARHLVLNILRVNPTKQKRG